MRLATKFAALRADVAGGGGGSGGGSGTLPFFEFNPASWNTTQINAFNSSVLANDYTQLPNGHWIYTGFGTFDFNNAPQVVTFGSEKVIKMEVLVDAANASGANDSHCVFGIGNPAPRTLPTTVANDLFQCDEARRYRITWEQYWPTEWAGWLAEPSGTAVPQGGHTSLVFFSLNNYNYGGEAASHLQWHENTTRSVIYSGSLDPGGQADYFNSVAYSQLGVSSYLGRWIPYEVVIRLDRDSSDGLIGELSFVEDGSTRCDLRGIRIGRFGTFPWPDFQLYSGKWRASRPGYAAHAVHTFMRKVRVYA